MDYSDRVKTLILEDFTKARARNARYSMRAYASRIGVAQSVISQVLNGNRPLTKKTARRILQGLGKNPSEIDRMLETFSEQPTNYSNLDMDQFHLISDWYYFGILSLAHTEGFQGKASWISRRLGISEPVASQALVRLLRLGLLAKNGKSIVPTNMSYSATSAHAHIALKKVNQDNLVLAEKALAEVAVDDRDYTSVTLCFDPDRMEDARRMIKVFRRNFDRVMESGRKREVYKLCIQLFPLTQPVTKR